MCTINPAVGHGVVLIEVHIVCVLLILPGVFLNGGHLCPIVVFWHPPGLENMLHDWSCPTSTGDASDLKGLVQFLCMCAGSQQLQVLLDEWITCKGEWSRSTLCERMTASKSVRKHGARVWLTRSQIAAKYNDHNVAMEICSAKLDDPAIRETQTKPHPDAPESEAERAAKLVMFKLILFLQV